MSDKKVIRVNFRKKPAHWSELFDGGRRPPHPHDFTLSRFDSPVDLVKFLRDVADKRDRGEL